VYLHQCTQLKKLNLEGLTAVKILWVEWCWQLKEIAGLSKLSSLHHLVVDECCELESLELGGLVSLELLAVTCCSKVSQLDVCGLRALRQLQIVDCQVQRLGSLGPLVQRLELRKCERLLKVDLGDHGELRHLDIRSCPVLRKVLGLVRRADQVELPASGSSQVLHLLIFGSRSHGNSGHLFVAMCAAHCRWNHLGRMHTMFRSMGVLVRSSTYLLLHVLHKLG
jgi:hypothetical protein